MKLTHFGHACILVEIPNDSTGARVLIDPGTYSVGFEELSGVDAILVTHAHPDHLDTERLTQLLERNPEAEVVCGQGVAEALAGISQIVHVVSPGDSLEVRGVGLAVTGGAHACIHPDLPDSENLGFLVANSLFHPGDALEKPPFDVDTLLVPAGGPWMKISEGIEFARAVAPRVAVPIHQAGLAPAHQQMHHQLLTKLAPTSTKVVVLEHGVAQEF
ncbi:MULTISPECIES: MBL fold metallo-hydrolase [unclassified Mycolicibacterium]|uniref:MBL fold metallo-hydrolase n=1 Tax=unclassified Mycolicibacterium TaxID=2636767 RepID=UPI002EDBA0FA